MALPIEDAPELEDSTQLSDVEAYAIIRPMLDELDSQVDEMKTYREYYDGEQALNYATDEFRKAFGEDFGDLVENWCEVAISATEERLELDRIVIRDEESGETDDKATRAIRSVLTNNDLEELENDGYSSGMIESRAGVMIWPTGDDDDPVRLHVMRGTTYFVVYDDDDPSKIRFAIRRWRTQLGQTNITLYTPEYVYKYKITRQYTEFLEDIRDVTSIEDSGWERRLTSETGDPSWPLQNPFDSVPIVEFRARKNRSELQNLWPIQDAINKLMVNMMVAADYGAHGQTYVITSNNEPDGGWKRRPGEVWHMQPEVDLDGKALPTEVGTLEAMDPSNFIAVLEHNMQVFSNLAAVPSYYLFSGNSQSGRGDAPSGDSLRVAETALMKKVEKYMERYGTSWLRIAEFIVEALEITAPYIDVSWKNPQRHFMGMLLEEANKMTNDLGLPPWVGWKHIGLSEPEIAEARRFMEEERERIQQEQQQQMEQQAQMRQQSSNQRPGNGIPQREANQMDNGGTPSNS